MLAGFFAMIAATIRPARWGVITAATAAPTALTGCYFIGTSIAADTGIPWNHVRIAVTMLAAVLVGAIIGRVAGGIREGS